jgi:hypothetical protein
LKSAVLDARHVSYLFPSCTNKKEMLVSAFVQLQGRTTPDELAHLRHQINDAKRGPKDIRPGGGRSMLHLISLCGLVEQEY